MPIQTFTPLIETSHSLNQQFLLPEELRTGGISQQFYTPLELAEGSLNQLFGPPLYEGPGLALFATASGLNFLRPTERFTLLDAEDPGLYTMFVLKILSITEIGALYVINGLESRLLTSADYTIQADVIVLSTALTLTQKLFVLPNSDFGLTFIGLSGTSLAVQNCFWLRRMANFDYSKVILYSEDLDKPKIDIIVDNITVFTQETTATLEGFTDLVIDSLTGCIVTFNDNYIGKVFSNTASIVTLERPYTQTLPGTVQIRSCGTLEFATENLGLLSNFDAALNFESINSLNGDIKIWVRESLTIPAFSTVYPNEVIKLLAVQSDSI